MGTSGKFYSEKSSGHLKIRVYDRMTYKKNYPFEFYYLNIFDKNGADQLTPVCGEKINHEIELLGKKRN